VTPSRDPRRELMRLTSRKLARALLVALLSVAGCSSGASNAGDPVELGAPTTPLRGRVALLGAADSSGAQVWIDDGSLATVTDADGTYFFPSVSEGVHTLHVKRGDWEEVVPRFPVIVGAGPLVDDAGALHPLQLLEVPRAHRLASTSGVNHLLASRGGVMFVGDSGTGPSGDLLGAGATDEAMSLLAPGVTWYNMETFSPDGTQILYLPTDCVYGEGGVTLQGSPLELVPVAGGVPLRLADSVACIPQYGGFTPDGTHVVYHLDASNHGPIRSVAATGGAPVDLGEGAIREVTNERALVVRGSLGPEGVSGELWSVALADGVGVKLAESGDGRFALGGTHVLYWKPDRTAALVPAVGGEERPLGTVSLGGLTFTPDGSRVVWIDSVPTPSEVKVAAVAGGNPTVIATTTGTALELSPDGDVVVFSGALADSAGRYRALEAVRLSDGARWTVATRARARPFTFGEVQPDPWPVYANQEFPHIAAFTPDGANVYFYGFDDNPQGVQGLCRVPVAGGTPERIGEEEPFALTEDRVVFISWMADLYTGTLSSAPIAGGPATVLAENVSPEAPLSISPDRSRIAFTVLRWPFETSCAGTLHVVPVAGGPAAPVLSYAGGAIWAGDSALYAWVCENAAPFTWRDGVYRVNVP
jgi:hypothetical protein